MVRLGERQRLGTAELSICGKATQVLALSFTTAGYGVHERACERHGGCRSLSVSSSSDPVFQERCWQLPSVRSKVNLSEWKGRIDDRGG